MISNKIGQDTHNDKIKQELKIHLNIQIQINNVFIFCFKDNENVLKKSTVPSRNLPGNMKIIHRKDVQVVNKPEPNQNSNDLANTKTFANQGVLKILKTNGSRQETMELKL